MKPRVRIVTISGLALGGFATVALAGIWQNARLIRERRVLQHELAILGAASEAKPLAQEEDGNAGARLAKLMRELQEERALLQTAQVQLTTLEKVVPAAKDEELRSFGRIEDMGREAAEFLPLLAEFAGKMKQGKAADLSENQAPFVAKLMPWLNRLQAIGEMEENPAEIARFHASTLQARLGLDAGTTEKVREQIRREFQLVREQGLSRPQRPDDQQVEWYRRRKEALDGASARVEALIPPSQREPNVVGQSLYLGTGMRTHSSIGADGHGSISMGLELPGIDVKP